MKRAFPGDPEYSCDRFYQLPYEYVLNGFWVMQKLHMNELHEQELPIALNTSVYANSQRDPKSNKKPYSPYDFTFYRPQETEGPAGYYAACYVQALELKRLPSWALFCYKDVAPGAVGEAGPVYALFAEDAILIGPQKTELGTKGFLIAQESASEQVRNFVDPYGEICALTVPLIETKVIAKEDVILN